jgi:anti-sigma-K factor RskA
MAEQEPGDAFGEMALLVEAPRSATIRCVDECRFLRIRSENFFGLTHKYPPLLIQMNKLMAQRVSLVDVPEQEMSDELRSKFRTDRRFEHDLAAYLLGALGPEETRDLEAHMASCERCRADERWLGAAVDVLPASVEQLEPPPHLRRRLMATVRGEGAVAGRSQKAGASPGRWRGLMLRPATAAAALAILAAGLAGYAIRGNSGVTTSTVAAQATPAAPGAQATIARTGDAAVMRIERLPVQRRGHVYEIWLRRGDVTEPSSLFVVRRDGSGTAAIPGGLSGVREVMVTMEPGRGSAQPTTAPVLRAEL